MQICHQKYSHHTKPESLCFHMIWQEYPSGYPVNSTSSVFAIFLTATWHLCNDIYHCKTQIRHKNEYRVPICTRLTQYSLSSLGSVTEILRRLVRGELFFTMAPLSPQTKVANLSVILSLFPCHLFWRDIFLSSTDWDPFS